MAASTRGKFTRGRVEISYEERGSGFPVLLLALGGMRSSVAFWDKAPWNPVEQLAQRYRAIAMDQRNAGRSWAPISAGDGWDDYAGDQLALLDHLGVDRFHVLGMCIGGSFILKLLDLAPERVASAAFLQPIGVSDDGATPMPEAFDEWAEEVAPSHPEADERAWAAFRETMFSGGRRYFSVADERIASIRTPSVVLAGDDEYHPLDASEALAATIPGAVFVQRWKEPERQQAARAAIEALFAAHTPSPGTH